MLLLALCRAPSSMCSSEVTSSAIGRSLIVLSCETPTQHRDEYSAPGVLWSWNFVLCANSLEMGLCLSKQTPLNPHVIPYPMYKYVVPSLRIHFDPLFPLQLQGAVRYSDSLSRTERLTWGSEAI